MNQKSKLQQSALGRALVILLCVLITAAFSLPNTVPTRAAAGNMSGTGTETDPYIVEDAEDFAKMKPEEGEYYKLSKDITVTTPYGDSSTTFRGNFDGNGYTITATIESSSNYTGLFAKLGSGAQISNLKLNGSIKSTSSNRRAYTGGIAAHANGTIAIRNCVSNADVEGNKAVGGIAGYSGGGVSIDRCGNTGKIYARNSQAGGIVGDADSGVTNISNCFNTGNISTVYSYAGGMVGQAAKSYAQETLTNCYSTGTCTAGSNPGSLMGLSSSRGTVTNCYVLNTAADKPVGSDSHSVIASISIKTAEEMKSADFVSLLNGEGSDAFVQDTTGSNGGYPVFKTAAAPQPVETTCTVSFDLDGGTIDGKDAVDSQTVKEGEKISDPGTPVKEGYNFEGWYSGDDKYDLTTPVTADISLKARWEAKEFTVKFDLNGGTVYDAGSGTNLKEIPAKTVKYGEKLDRIYVSAPKGYGQLGWYNGETKFDMDQDVVTSDMTLTYKWQLLVYYATPKVIDKDTKQNISDPAIKVTYKTTEDEWTGEEYETTETLKPGTDGTYHMNKGTTYSYEISAKGYKTATGTYTPSGDDVDVTWTVALEKLSEEYTKLKQISDKFAGGSSYTLLRAKYGTDTNVNTMIKSVIDKYDIDTSDVTVSLVSTADQSVIAANGDITYNRSAIPNLSKVYTNNIDVKVKFACGSEEISDAGARVQVGWDLSYFKGNMQAEADQLTFDKIKGDNDSADSITTDLTLPRTITSAGVTSGNSMQNIWSEAEWTSDSDAITITRPEIDSSIYPATGTVHRGAEDQEVTLTARFKANDTLLNSYVGETVDRLGYITKEFKVTVKADPEETRNAIKDDLQKKLDAGMENHGLRDAVTDEPVDTGNITGNFDFPKTRDFKYTDDDGTIHAVDGKYQPVTIKSSNEDVIKDQGVNAPRVLVYRPLPGESAEEVTVTVTITDKETGISVSKDVKVTVQPLTNEEIENAKSLMKKAVDGYWDGIKNANTDKADITSDLQPFQEIVTGTNGEPKFIYTADEKTYTGISADTYKEKLSESVDDPGYSDNDYRRFNSSVKTVIADSSLLMTKPQYDTEVTVDSYLTDNVYGKYYVKAKKDGNQKTMDLFADLYRQHAAATVTVKGDEPKPTPVPSPEKKTRIAKIFASGSYGSKKISVKWKKIKGASGYEIYVAKCGSKGKLTQKKYLAKTVKNGSSAKAYLKKTGNGKKLNVKSTYKVQVRAYKVVSGKKQYVSTSPAMHFVSTKNAKYTNAKKVTAPKAVSVKAGKTKKITAKAYKAAPAKKWIAKGHGNRIRYYITDSSVAKVTKAGRISAKKKGSCIVYAVALNGVKAKVKVTVK